MQLHDASGSVNPKDFALGQQAASLLIDQFGPETHVAVAQFADECLLECQLTGDRELVKAKNQGGSSFCDLDPPSPMTP